MVRQAHHERAVSQHFYLHPTRAMSLMRGVNRACFDTAQQAQHVQTLVWLVDDYKLTLQLCMDVGAFKNAAKGMAHFNQSCRVGTLLCPRGKKPALTAWAQKTCPPYKSCMPATEQPML